MSNHTTALLAEIDETTRAVYDLGSLRDARRKEGSRRRAYKKALDEVRDIAGKPAATMLAQWICEQIREDEELPSARRVRNRGAEIVRDAGHQVSTGSWLGA